MVVYKTKAGQMWDEIAFEQLGNCKYVSELMAANPTKLNYFVFPANVELNLPEIEEPTAKVTSLPAWWK